MKNDGLLENDMKYPKSANDGSVLQAYSRSLREAVVHLLEWFGSECSADAEK